MSSQPTHKIITDVPVEFESSFAPMLTALSSPHDRTVDKPWLWNLNSQSPEPTTPAAALERDASSTRAGATENLRPFAPSDPDKVKTVQESSFRTNGVKAANQHDPILLSSRSSVDFGTNTPVTKADANGASTAIANGTKPLSPEASLRNSSTSSNRNSRLGSMTRRWSQLGIGKKGSKDKVRSTIEPLAE